MKREREGAQHQKISFLPVHVRVLQFCLVTLLLKVIFHPMKSVMRFPIQSNEKAYITASNMSSLLLPPQNNFAIKKNKEDISFY